MPHARGDSGSFLSLKRYDEYYLAGGDLFFLVEHNVFRVHRYFFERESSFFGGKLATPASPGATRQGTSETNAIVLEDVRADEFAQFLWVFYNPKYSLYDATVGDWSAILTLAHRWLFPEVKALAVRELERLDMSDIDRVVTYHNNDVDRNLLIPRYAALCEREEPLSLAEGYRLGLETALTIARAREIARRELPGLSSPTSPSFHGSGLVGIVRDLFGIPALEDDTVDQTSPGGPRPPLTPPSTVPPSTTSTPPAQLQSQQTALLPRQKMAQPIKRPPTPPQETPSPPPPSLPPKQMERPQLQTGRQKTQPTKAKQPQPTADQSRPQTPVPETPVTESTNQGPKTAAQKRAAKKAAGAKKKEEMVAATGSQTPRSDEAAANPGEPVQPQDGGPGEGKEEKETENTNGEVVGEPSHESTEAGSSNAAPVVIRTAKDEDEGKSIGATANGDFTDITTTVATTFSQDDDPKINLQGSSSLNTTFADILSPQERQGGLVINNDDLKSPQEKSTPLSFFDEMLRKF